MKWYWRADAKYVTSPEALLQEYAQDGRFAFVIVAEGELALFLAAAAGRDFQPLLKSGNVIMVVQRDHLPADAGGFDVKLPQNFFR